MGITGEFVRSVLYRSRSVSTQGTSASSNVVEKRKWKAVKLYLCGKEFNSVLAEEDSASVKSSEATVTQPIVEDLTDKEDSMSKLFHQEDAAIIIQSAFRHFLARRRNEEDKTNDSKQEPVSGRESPGRESMGTSIEVQTGNSVEGSSLEEESTAVTRCVHQKARTQIFRIKEDWDDSTVSSNVSKMRIQNRLEAMTKRERALAYAFSQQLRTCSKKKERNSDGTELNVGWSWLERWMATRIPESSSVESHTSNQLEPFKANNQRLMVRKGFFDVAGEEKESCGSNEVSVQPDSFSVTAAAEVDGFKPTKNRLKPTRTVSRQKTVPSCHCPKEGSKVRRKNSSKESGIDKKMQKQEGSKKEINCSGDTAAA